MTVAEIGNNEKNAYQKEGERGDDIRPWITGFVRLFGEQKVKFLLGNTGMPAGYTVSNKTGASWQELHRVDVGPLQMPP
jgi:hypothetical protein